MDSNKNPNANNSGNDEFNISSNESADLSEEQQGFTEEDFAPSPPKPKGPLSRLPSRQSAIPALIGFTIFLLVSVYDWFSPISLAVSKQSIYQDQEYWRLVTALFVHADAAHLLANTPLFIIFGWFLFAFFGTWIFPVIAVVAGCLTNLITVSYYPDATRLVGASGMLYAMVALWLVLYIRFDTDHSKLMRLFRAIAFSLALLFPTTFRPQTSYLAHGVGFLLGIAFGLIVMHLVKVKDLQE